MIVKNVPSMKSIINEQPTAIYIELNYSSYLTFYLHMHILFPMSERIRAMLKFSPNF